MDDSSATDASCQNSGVSEVSFAPRPLPPLPPKIPVKQALAKTLRNIRRFKIAENLDEVASPPTDASASALNLIPPPRVPPRPAGVPSSLNPFKESSVDMRLPFDEVSGLGLASRLSNSSNSSKDSMRWQMPALVPAPSTFSDAPPHPPTIVSFPSTPNVPGQEPLHGATNLYLPTAYHNYSPPAENSSPPDGTSQASTQLPRDGSSTPHPNQPRITPGGLASHRPQWTVTSQGNQTPSSSSVMERGTSRFQLKQHLDPEEEKIAFPVLLFRLIQDPESTGAIAWSSCGKGFSVRNSKELTACLPKYFRHSKYSSLQRQLNIYGWRKMSEGSLKGNFYHPLFHRGMATSELTQITKKYTQKRYTKRPSKRAGPKIAPPPPLPPPLSPPPHAAAEEATETLLGFSRPFDERGGDENSAEEGVPIKKRRVNPSDINNMQTSHS